MQSVRWMMGLAMLMATGAACAGDEAGTPVAGGVVDGTEMPGLGGAGQGGANLGGVDPMAAASGEGPTAVPMPAVGASGEIMPCAVSAVVQKNCLGCHGAQPIGNSTPLVTFDDWHQPSTSYGPNVLGDPGKRVYEVAQIRINNGEMPQNGPMEPDDHAMLDAWLSGGAIAGSPTDPTCNAAPTTMTDDTLGLEEGQTLNECERPGAYDPLVAKHPNEVCYDLLVHDVSAPGDTTPFQVPMGETYHELYYEVPWKPGDQMTGFGGRFDNLEVLHHYLVFASNAAGKTPGQVDKNVLGTTLGSSATLISGWAVGGCSLEYPEHVGAELPTSQLVMVQWHMYNYTGSPQLDSSAAQICVVPAGTRPNTAGITFLGTENFNGPFGMPPGPSSFTSQCTNNSGGPVTLIGFTPHMHTIGTNMKTDLKRLDGSVTTLFDEPFKFDYQVGYRIPETVVMPGETLITTCSFNNDTGSSVAFGQSTNQEMCYQYALAYPAGALDNGVPSLIGALNTCW